MSPAWLALLVRMLRTESRLMRTHVFRMLVAACILLALVQAHGSAMVIGAPGQALFSLIVYLNFGLITLLGLTFFSLAITEEKEEGTLGLLKMAGISPLALLLGKSTAQLISRVFLLSVQVPFILLAVTLGGVTLGQIAAAYAALLAYLVLVANVSLAASVCCRRGGNAAGLAGFVLAAFLAGGPLAQALYTHQIRRLYVAVDSLPDVLLSQGLKYVVEANCVRRLMVVMQSGFTGSTISFQVISNLVLAAGFFALAWATFEWFTREETPIASPRGFAFRSTGRFRRWGVGRAWPNGLMWKDFYFTAGGQAEMLVKSLLFAGVTIFGVWMTYNPPYNTDVRELIGVWMMGGGLVALVAELSFAASRLFRDEVHGKTLPALMMLPVSMAGVVYSKIAGCLVGLLPAAVWFLLGAVAYPEGCVKAAAEVLPEPGVWYGVSHFLLFLHTTTLLSLYVKWGALPLAFVLAYMMPSCLLSPVGVLVAFSGSRAYDEGVVFGVMLCVCVGLSAALQYAIAARLRVLAGQ